MPSDTERKVSRSVRTAADLWCDEGYGGMDCRKVLDEYRTSILKKLVFIVVCVVATVLAAGLSLGTGQYHIDFFECYRIVWNHITGNIQDKMLDYFVVEQRLPRIVVGIATGAGLAACGCVMQSIMKNPLADPYTTGISSGASFGATMAITMGITIGSGAYALVVNSFVFALIPMAVIVAVSKMNNSSPTTMIMAGLAVMYIFNAVTSVMKLIADPDSLQALYSWQIGTLANVGSWEGVALIVAVVIVGSLILQMSTRKLNILSTGDEGAKAMGLKVDSIRRILLVLITLVVATVVSFTGLIGFVGLVAPHIGRLFVGSDNRYLLPASALFGATLMVIADLVGRNILSHGEMQVGIITSFIGGPLFLYLIIRQNRTDW
ncbi:MAG: iron ABC transporter permease [archaeon]|nr:iron ABC transporter permease [archaeon]